MCHRGIFCMGHKVGSLRDIGLEEVYKVGVGE